MKTENYLVTWGWGVSKPGLRDCFITIKKILVCFGVLTKLNVERS